MILRDSRLDIGCSCSIRIEDKLILFALETFAICENVYLCCYFAKKFGFALNCMVSFARKVSVSEKF
jgi:hypothetical protein